MFKWIKLKEKKIILQNKFRFCIDNLFLHFCWLVGFILNPFSLQPSSIFIGSIKVTLPFATTFIFGVKVVVVVVREE